MIFYQKLRGKTCDRNRLTNRSITKAVFITAALMIGAAAPAFAEKLHPKWSQSRATANSLGDLAKAGDKAAFAQLKEIALAGDAPAMHNMGWLFQTGFPGHPVDGDETCKWYGDGAALDYPPSMYNFAFCKFAESNSSGDLNHQWAISLLSDAAYAGWTASAIYLSEYILNANFPAKENISDVYKLARQGLETNPTQSERTTLSYLLGMAVIMGAAEIDSVTGRDELDPMDRQRTYRDGEQALRDAVGDNHPAAGQELPRIRTLWAEAIIDDAASWRPPGPVVQDCYEKVQDPEEKKYFPQSCFALFSISKRRLNTFRENAGYLVELLSDEERPAMRDAMHKLDQASEKFRADLPLWEDQFVPAYVKRTNEGGWP